MRLFCMRTTQRSNSAMIAWRSRPYILQSHGFGSTYGGCRGKCLLVKRNQNSNQKGFKGDLLITHMRNNHAPVVAKQGNTAQQYRFRDAECHVCGKKGHIAWAGRSKPQARPQRKSTQSAFRNKTRPQSTHVLLEEE